MCYFIIKPATNANMLMAIKTTTSTIRISSSSAPCALLRLNSNLYRHVAEYIGCVFMKKENVDFLGVTAKELIG